MQKIHFWNIFTKLLLSSRTNSCGVVRREHSRSPSPWAESGDWNRGRPGKVGRVAQAGGSERVRSHQTERIHFLGHRPQRGTSRIRDSPQQRQCACRLRTCTGEYALGANLEYPTRWRHANVTASASACALNVLKLKQAVTLERYVIVRYGAVKGEGGMTLSQNRIATKFFNDYCLSGFLVEKFWR